MITRLLPLLFLPAFSDLPPLEPEFEEYREFEEIGIKPIKVPPIVVGEPPPPVVEEPPLEEDPPLPPPEKFPPEEEPPPLSSPLELIPDQESREELIEYVNASPIPPCSSCPEWGIRESNLYEMFVKEGSTVIDFGAKNGMHTLALSKLVGEQGRVVAFESRPEFFKEMYWNLIGAEVDNVQIYCVPFWEKEKMLDGYYFENVSLIRIDAHGREDLFFKGAIGTLLKCRPVLIINMLGGMSVEKLDQYVEQELTRRLETLWKMGYMTKRLEKSLYLAVPKGYEVNGKKSQSP